MQQSIVGLTVEDSTSSGVVVAPGQVITCYHVIAPVAEQAEGQGIIIRYQDKEYPAKIIRGEKNHDLCLLEAPNLPAPPVKIANTLPHIGATVTAMGMPAGFFEQSSGHIEYFNQGDDAPIMCNTAPTRPGYSGGGLFNKQGKLTGIAAYRTAYGALPIAWVKRLLARRDNALQTLAQETEASRYLDATVLRNDALNTQSRRLANHMIRYLDTWVQAHPDSYFANTQRAEFLGDTAEEQQAAYASAKRAYALYPNHNSLYRLADNAGRCGDPQTAITLWWKLANDYASRRNHALDEIINTAYQLPPAEQIDAYRQVIQAPNVSDLVKSTAYFAMACFYKYQRNPELEKALRAYRECFRLNPNDRIAQRSVLDLELQLKQNGPSSHFSR